MQPLYLFGKIVIQPFFRLLFPTKLIGKSRKKFIKPAILTANHYSSIDPFIMAMYHSQQISFLSKRELWEKKYLRRIMKSLGMVGIDRGKPDIGAIKDILGKLKNNRTIGIFPEGTRNKQAAMSKHGGSMLKISGGATMFAIKSRTPIVPMMFWRKAKIFRRNILLCADAVYFDEFYSERLNSETLAKANLLLAEKMSEVKQILDYYLTLRGAPKREMFKELKNYQLPFNVVYEKYKPFLDQSTKVITDDSEEN